MPHTRVELRRDLCAESSQDLGGEEDALRWNVEVNIAAAEKDGRASQRTGIVARCAVGSDQAAAQAGDSTVATRVADRELKRETCPLREAGLVARNGREEAVGIPRVASRLRCEVGKTGLVHLACEAQDVFRRRPAP